MNETYDWAGYFERFFEEVKREFKQRHPYRDKSELSPIMNALVDGIENLPVPVGIIDVSVDTARHSYIRDEICQLVRFDFSKYGSRDVSYYGLVDSNSPNEFSLLLTNLGFSDSEKLAKDFFSDLRIIGFENPENPEIYFMFGMCDVRKNLQRFVDQFLMMFSTPMLPRQIVEKFLMKEIDFDALYGLAKDRITSVSENIEQAKERGYPGASFEQLQEHVAHIQLIPTVPEDVQKVFKRAKELYIFGYFRYQFFIISQHYAYLALESAIKHRYILSLCGKAILKNRKGETEEMSQPSHWRIREFCRNNRKLGWDERELKVNDEPFPHSPRRLLDWLVNKGLITKWERGLFDTSIYLRNAMSHLETASTTMPSPETLKQAAYKINCLFHNLFTGKNILGENSRLVSGYMRIHKFMQRKR